MKRKRCKGRSNNNTSYELYSSASARRDHSLLERRGKEKEVRVLHPGGAATGKMSTADTAILFDGPTLPGGKRKTEKASSVEAKVFDEGSPSRL